MRYGTIDNEYAMRLATCPEVDDGPILMVNFMQYRQQADYSSAADTASSDAVTGDAGASAEISGREADDKYAPIDVLRTIGARVVFVGDVVDSSDDRSTRWDRVGIVKYPSRRAFIEMQSRKDFQSKHVHKDAGMEFTIILASLPTALCIGEGDSEGLVTFIAHQAGAVPESLAEGAMLDVEGRIIGDDRTWSNLAVHYGAVDTTDLAPGAMVVRVRPTMEKLRSTIDRWNEA